MSTRPALPLPCPVCQTDKHCSFNILDVRYWRNIVLKQHGITQKLIVVKTFGQGKIIVVNYNIHKFII
jgi:hypothetical protein